jgi:hypothetical protein
MSGCGSAEDDVEVKRYRDLCASRLGHLDELVLEWVEGRTLTACFSTPRAGRSCRTSMTGSTRTIGECWAPGRRTSAWVS